MCTGIHVGTYQGVIQDFRLGGGGGGETAPCELTDAALADGESFLSQKTGDRVGLVPFAEVTHDMLAIVHTYVALDPPLSRRDSSSSRSGQ